MRGLRLLWSVAVGEGLLLALYAFAFEPGRLALTVVRRTWPTDRPRRFLLLSDMHLHPWSRRTFHRIARAATWARSAGATHAFIAGDLLETDEEAELVATLLRRALGDLPALYVSGNHEVKGDFWWARHRNDPARIADAMARHRIECIDGRVVEADGLPILGIGWPGWHPGAPADAVARLAGFPAPAVVLAHSPDHLRGLAADRILLAICGHTHGGQVRLPLVGAPWIPVRVPLARVAGAMHVDAIPTYVLRGIGATIPVRLGAVPEAALLEVGPSGPAATSATKIVEIRSRSPAPSAATAATAAGEAAAESARPAGPARGRGRGRDDA